MNSSTEVWRNIEQEMDTRKRRLSEQSETRQSDAKRSRRMHSFRMDSESAIDSDGTESVYSIQGKETDVVRDSTDAETFEGSDSDDDDDLVTLEYDVASASSIDDDDFPDYSSSGTEDLNIQAAAEGAFAAVLLDTSREAWDTDGETSSDGSSVFDFRKDFFTCLQCKSHNDNPSFRYCDKCFQVRKTLFPPRPKPSRKRKLPDRETRTTTVGRQQQQQHKVKLDTLENCLNELKKTGAQGGVYNAGESSSQHIPNLNFQDIIVPKAHLNKCTPEVATTDTEEEEEEAAQEAPAAKRVRLDTSPLSSSSEEIHAEIAKSEDVGVDADKKKLLELGIHLSQPSDDVLHLESDSGVSSQNTCDIECTQQSSSSSSSSSTILPHADDMCVVCSNAPKNGIFLHGYIGHLCCCYKCAMRVWKASKRCPICNCKVKQVIKLFTS